MSYFFNQRKLKPKTRSPINFEDVSKQLKIYSVENVTEFSKPKSEITETQLDSVPPEQKPSSLPSTVVPNKKSVKRQVSPPNNLPKLYGKSVKKSDALLEELEQLLGDTRCSLKSPNVWTNMSHESLRGYLSQYSRWKGDREDDKVANDSPVHSRSVVKERKSAKEKWSHLPNQGNNDPKQVPSTIQFQLSSEKFINWIQDENLSLTISTIEWILSRLRCSINKVSKSNCQVTPAIEYYHSSSDLVLTPDQPSLCLPTPSYFESVTVHHIGELLRTVRDHLQIVLSRNAPVNTAVSAAKKGAASKTRQKGAIPRYVVLCDGAKTIFYPNGKLAIIYFTNATATSSNIHYLFGYNLDGQMVICLSNIHHSNWIFNWHQTIQINSNNCNIYNNNFQHIKSMKWPQNSNNKLSQTVSIKFNDYLSFYCKSKSDIIVRFSSLNNDNSKKCKSAVQTSNFTRQQANVMEVNGNFKEFLVHKWLFDEVVADEPVNLIRPNTSKPKLKASIDSGKTIVSSKGSKSASNVDNNIEILEEFLLNKQTIIRKQFTNWITHIRHRLNLSTVLGKRHTTNSGLLRQKSAIPTLGNRVHFFTEIRDNDVPRASTTVPGNRAVITRSASQSFITESPQVTCPLKTRLLMLSPSNADFQTSTLRSHSAISPDICLCNRYQVPEITDLELDEFLSKIPRNEIIILAVTSERHKSVETNSKEKIVEKSLTNLITRIYSDDLQATTQKPCVYYHQNKRAYRLLMYNIDSAGRYLQCSQANLLKQHRIIPGMCLMFRNKQLLFADFIFNGYNSTKKDLFKQISLSKSNHDIGFFIPDDFHLSYNNENQNWMSENAYSKIISQSKVIK